MTIKTLAVEIDTMIAGLQQALVAEVANGGGGVKCARCKAAVDRLEIFPGNVCLACWAASPEGRYVPTVEEFTQAWTKKVFQ